MNERELQESRSKLRGEIGDRLLQLLWNVACSSWTLWLYQVVPGMPKWTQWPLFGIVMMLWQILDEIRAANQRVLEEKKLFEKTHI